MPQTLEILFENEPIAMTTVAVSSIEYRGRDRFLQTRRNSPPCASRPENSFPGPIGKISVRVPPKAPVRKLKNQD